MFLEDYFGNIYRSSQRIFELALYSDCNWCIASFLLSVLELICVFRSSLTEDGAELELGSLSQFKTVRDLLSE